MRLKTLQKHVEDLDRERTYSPKGFLQPIYNLCGKKIEVHSNTSSGKKGIILEVDSVSQGFDAQIGRMGLTLKFKSGSNLTLPIPSEVSKTAEGYLLLSFKKFDPNEDVAIPYRKMRKNVNGYTRVIDDCHPEVVIKIIEEPKQDV